MGTVNAPVVQLASDSTFDAVAALGSGWVYEPKLDGHRLLVSGQGCWTRTPRAVRYEAIEAACPEGALLDCELVTATGRSTASRVNGLRCQGGADALRAMAFDVLEVGGASVRHLPQRERRALLVGLSLAGALSTIASYDDAEEAMDTSEEGIIAKHTSASYVHARTNDFLKAKWSYRYTASHIDTRPNCRGQKHGTTGDLLHDEVDWSAVEAAPRTPRRRPSPGATPRAYRRRRLRAPAGALVTNGRIWELYKVFASVQADQKQLFPVDVADPMAAEWLWWIVPSRLAGKDPPPCGSRCGSRAGTYQKCRAAKARPEPDFR